MDKPKVNRCRQAKRDLYTKMGFDIESKKVCGCCDKNHYITKFPIHLDRNYPSIVTVVPVCEECSFKHYQGYELKNWKPVWREFFKEIAIAKEELDYQQFVG